MITGSQFQFLGKIAALLSAEERVELWGISLAVLLMAALEVVGIASITPFIALVADPSMIGRSACRGTDDGDRADLQVERFARGNPDCVRYDFSEQQLVNNPLIQRLMADRSFIAVAQNYLQAQPIVDVVAMWWNVASPRPDKGAAQYWHFDMDRIKWLKFFVYLTDVGPENGPHSFVAGSHRSGGISGSLLQKGYSRLIDEEVGSSYPPDKFIEFTAPRGTVIAEDTRGLHKGKHVTKDDRLIFQLQFSNSLFGGDYPKCTIRNPSSPLLAEMMSNYPRLYSHYT
jgi:phytanoyl-CoA dioxygenase PhyH